MFQTGVKEFWTCDLSWGDCGVDRTFKIQELANWLCPVFCGVLCNWLSFCGPHAGTEVSWVGLQLCDRGRHRHLPLWGGQSGLHWSAARILSVLVQQWAYSAVTFFSQVIMCVIISLRLLFTLIKEHSFESFMCLDLRSLCLLSPWCLCQWLWGAGTWCTWSAYVSVLTVMVDWA